MIKLPRRTLAFVLMALSLASGVLLLLNAWPPLRMGAGIFQIILLPGYALLTVLFPPRRRLAPVWRWSLIVPASLAVVGLLLLITNYFFAYEYGAVVGCLTIVNLVLLMLGARRASQTDWISTIPAARRFRLRQGHVAVVLAGAFLIAATVFALSNPKRIQHTTEFYVLNVDRTLPTAVHVPVSGPLRLIVGVVNRETQTASYTVAVYDATQKLYESPPVVINSGDAYEKTIEVPIPATASDEILQLQLTWEGRLYRQVEVALAE